MAEVTVTGVGSTKVTIPFTSASQAALAKALASTINSEVAAGTLVPVNAVGPIAPDPVIPNELVVQQGGALVLNPLDLAVVVVAAGSVNMLGDGIANQSVIAGSGGLTYLTNGGSGTVVAAGGANLIVTSAVGNAGWEVSTGSCNDTLSSQSGNDTLAAGLGHNEIILGTGKNLVDVTGHDTVLAGSGAETVAVETGGHAVVFGGASQLLFLGGNLADTVSGGTGTDTIFGGRSGGDYIGGTAGGNLIYASGTIFGGGHGDQLYAMGGLATQIHAASGNETLSTALSSGADTLFAGFGSDKITLGTGPNTLVAGHGNATVFGGVGADLYEFIKGSAGGNETIHGFDFGGTVKLIGYEKDEIADALAHAHVTAAGTSITLSDNTQITFADVNDLGKTHFT